MNESQQRSVPPLQRNELASASLDGVFAYGAGVLFLLVAQIWRWTSHSSGRLGSIVYCLASFVVLVVLALRTWRVPRPETKLLAVSYIISRSLVGLTFPPTAFLVLLASGPHMLARVLPYAASAVGCVTVFSIALLRIARKTARTSR